MGLHYKFSQPNRIPTKLSVSYWCAKYSQKRARTLLMKSLNRLENHSRNKQCEYFASRSQIKPFIPTELLSLHYRVVNLPKTKHNADSPKGRSALSKFPHSDGVGGHEQCAPTFPILEAILWRARPCPERPVTSDTTSGCHT